MPNNFCCEPECVMPLYNPYRENILLVEVVRNLAAVSMLGQDFLIPPIPVFYYLSMSSLLLIPVKFHFLFRFG